MVNQLKFWQEQGKVWEELPFRMFYFGKLEEKVRNALVGIEREGGSR